MKHFLLTGLFLLLVSCASQQSLVLPRDMTASFVTRVDLWQASPGMIWQWQLSGDVDTSVNADIYDIDLIENDSSVIDELHAQGRKVICYISVGSWEAWRPDADQFPEQIIGKNYEGWPDEKWLDIRQIDLLAEIMRARLDLCAAKGFDGVETDNIEVDGNDSGFPISYQDQLNYAVWLAEEAHQRGLAIGLKNAPEMANDALPYFDFAITEDCFFYGWCEEMTSFIEAGKAVFAAEYTDMVIDFKAACQQAEGARFSLILKNRSLDEFRQTCP